MTIAKWKKTAILTLFFGAVLIAFIRKFALLNSPSPHVKLNLPSHYTDFKTMYPIEVSGWQPGKLRFDSYEQGRQHGSLRFAIYKFENKKRRCIGAVTCVIDLEGEGDISLLMGTTLPIEIGTNKITDYSITRDTNSPDAWIVFHFKERKGLTDNY
jgi:hypothetical protein